MGIKLLAFMLSLGIFLFVIELVRRERLTFKYALGWLVASALAVFFSFFHKFLFAIAKFCGFELPSNFIFFGLLCTFVVLGLLLTVFLCQQNNRNDRMAKKIGILEFELQELKKKIFSKE
jgi:protein-S-isoprenylcysteine O-methyltransferase Ste14